MTDTARTWLPGAEPEHKCTMCGAAASLDQRCLAHLNDAALLSALGYLRSGSLVLDLRGVELDSARWMQITKG